MREQNIYDDPIFFASYSALRAGELNYNTLLEQPAMAKLLPGLTEKTALDCGKAASNLSEEGAEKVVGIDLSERMLEVARREASHPQITYCRHSMSELSEIEGRFDLVYSSLAFHDVEDFAGLTGECYRLLRPGGVLLFSQEPPIVTATEHYGGHFNCDASGQEVSFIFSGYGHSGPRESFWFAEGVRCYHRTMGEILTAVARVLSWRRSASRFRRTGRPVIPGT